MFAKPVTDPAARAQLGKFLLTQLPLPAKRVQRVMLCQALENLAEPELGPGLAALIIDPQNVSLRGRLCLALARSGTPRAAELIADVLESGDDETKVWALEALGTLKASAQRARLEKYAACGSDDKEWTRAIQKAAAKALKALGNSV